MSVGADPASAAREALVAAIGRVAAGERAALEQVYRATSAKLFAICLRILDDSREAEDALQDVYVDLWKSAGRYDARRASPISWLACMARNRAVDRLRAGGKVRAGAVPEEAAHHLADTGPAADDLIETEQRNARIHACIDELETRQREAVRSAFIGGATYREVAQAQGVPLGTMKSWIRRALARLRNCIEGA